MFKKGKHRNRKIKSSAGFTMIELLLTLAIIVILTGASLSIARFSDTQKNLTLSANKLRALIRSAQNYALAIPNFGQEHICGFGVYFSDSKTARLFYTKASVNEFKENAGAACESYNHLSAVDIGRTIIETVVLSVDSQNTGTDNDVFFRSPYGEVYANGTALNDGSNKEYELKSESFSKSVTVNSAGKID